MRTVSRYHLVLILALGLLCAALLLNEHLVPAGDNSTYIVLAQSLLTGRGYRMISDPRAPEMGLYPPAYPLLLAGVLALTDTAHDLRAAILSLKLPSIVLWLGMIALVYDLLRWRGPAKRMAGGSTSRCAQDSALLHSSLRASLTTLLIAVSLPLLHYAAEVGSEIPYLFCSLACLWCFEWYRRSSRKVALALTIGLLALTFYVRSIALVMAAAFALYLLVERPARGMTGRSASLSSERRDAVALLLAVAILAAPWFIRGQSLPDTGTAVGLGRGYFDLYLSYDPYGLEPAGLSGWAERVAQNLVLYTFDIWPVVVFPHVSSLRAWLPGDWGMLLGGLFTLLIVLGFVLEARRGEVSEWYVAVFFASCVGYLWAQTRLIVPILPFALYYFVVAVDTLLQCLASLVARCASRPSFASQPRQNSSGMLRFAPQQYMLMLVCAVLTLSSLRADVRRIQRNLRHGLGQPLATYYDDPEWGNYLRAMNWIAENGASDSIVVCRKADLMYIVTGHLALEYPYSQDEMDLRRTVRDNRVAYVIEDAFSWTGTTTFYLQPALRSWEAAEPGALSLVFETDEPRTRVWRVEKLN